MTFLPITAEVDVGDEAVRARDSQQQRHGRGLTGMRDTLLAHLPSFRAYEEWLVLRDELVPFIGERAVALFSYAIADENDSLACAAYFRRSLVDAGEDGENPQVTETEQALMDWGRLIARDPRGIPDAMYARIEASFTPHLRLILVAYAGQLVAVTLLNSVGRIPLDPELYPYRRPGDTRTA